LLVIVRLPQRPPPHYPHPIILTPNLASPTAAPVLEEELQDVSLPMGETASFTCRGRGEPKPSVSWTRDGIPFPGGETVGTAVDS
jgi:hypothetical protein